MNKIKVCYLLNDFDVGGTSKVVYDIIKEIDFEKFKISFVTLSGSLEFAKQVELPPQIEIFTFNYYFDTNYSLRRYFSLAYFPSIIKSRAKDILHQIEELSPDILHLHVLPRELMIGILAKKKLMRLQLIYTDHSLRIGESESTWLKRNLLARVYRKLYRNFHVVAVSKAVQKGHQRFRWLNSKNKNILIENRINIKDYPKKIHHSENTIQVVYVARLFDAKGHMELLSAWKSIQNPNLTLKLIGDGYLEEAIRTYIEEHDLMGVLLTGNISNVAEHLAESDIAVFPSEKEGLPIALLEKMAVGLPVISSNIPELLDFVRDGENGLVYHKGSPVELAQRIKLLCHDSKLRTELGVNARKSVLRRIGNQTLAELTAKHYKDVLDQKNEL